MPAATIPSQTKNHDELIAFTSALLIVMFLFFIDEGYYDFRWMKEWGNWIVFVFYLAFFFLIQWLLARFLFGRLKLESKALLMFFIGIPLTVGLALWIFS